MKPVPKKSLPAPPAAKASAGKQAARRAPEPPRRPAEVPVASAPEPIQPIQQAPERKPIMNPEPELNTSSQILRGGAGNVDKIRDILFGTQMRDYEARFARLEETLVKETVEIREANRRRFEQLEGFIKRELESLQARLKSERDERLDNVSQQSRELKDASDTLSRRLRDLDDRESASERSLRNDLMETARNLGEEIHARHDEMAALLDKRVHELRDGKTDRAALASLFNEVALRLSDQFQIPGSEE